MQNFVNKSVKIFVVFFNSRKKKEVPNIVYNVYKILSESCIYVIKQLIKVRKYLGLNEVSIYSDEKMPIIVISKSDVPNEDIRMCILYENLKNNDRQTTETHRYFYKFTYIILHFYRFVYILLHFYRFTYMIADIFTDLYTYLPKKRFSTKGNNDYFSLFYKFSYIFFTLLYN